MSNLRSLYKQYGLLFRHTVKDLEERELPCRQFTYLEAFLLQPARPLLSQNPCWGLTPSQASIPSFNRTMCCILPRLSEKSAWCKHCGKGNPWPRRNFRGQMRSIKIPHSSSSLSCFPFVPPFSNKYSTVVTGAIAGPRRSWPLVQCWSGICASLTLLHWC